VRHLSTVLADVPKAPASSPLLRPSPLSTMTPGHAVEASSFDLAASVTKSSFLSVKLWHTFQRNTAQQTTPAVLWRPPNIRFHFVERTFMQETRRSVSVRTRSTELSATGLLRTSPAWSFRKFASGRFATPDSMSLNRTFLAA